MAELPPSEVKGIWFVAARDYARQLHGAELVERMVAASPMPYRDIYASPIASAWYPEAAFEQGLIVIYDVMTEGNDVMFERIMEGCTEHGINRLFRMLLRASSPSFVLRRVPTMWRQIRRGAGHVDVEQVEGETHIRYSELPWFHNPLYRMMTAASLRALVRCCTGENPRIEITDHTRSSLSLSIRYKAESVAPPVRFTSTRPPASSSHVSNLAPIARAANTPSFVPSQSAVFAKPANSQLPESAARDEGKTSVRVKLG